MAFDGDNAGLRLGRPHRDQWTITQLDTSYIVPDSSDQASVLTNRYRPDKILNTIPNVLQLGSRGGSLS